MEWRNESISKRTKTIKIFAILTITILAGCIENVEKKENTTTYQNEEFLTWFQISIETLQLYLNHTSDALTFQNWQEAKFWAEELMNFTDEQMTTCMSFHLTEPYSSLRNKYYQALNHCYLGAYYTKKTIIDLENYDYDSLEKDCDKAVNYFHQTKNDIDHCILIIYTIGGDYHV